MPTVIKLYSRRQNQSRKKRGGEVQQQHKEHESPPPTKKTTKKTAKKTTLLPAVKVINVPAPPPIIRTRQKQNKQPELSDGEKRDINLSKLYNISQHHVVQTQLSKAHKDVCKALGQYEQSKTESSALTNKQNRQARRGAEDLTVFSSLVNSVANSLTTCTAVGTLISESTGDFCAATVNSNQPPVVTKGPSLVRQQANENPAMKTKKRDAKCTTDLSAPIPLTISFTSKSTSKDDALGSSESESTDKLIASTDLALQGETPFNTADGLLAHVHIFSGPLYPRANSKRRASSALSMTSSIPTRASHDLSC